MPTTRAPAARPTALMAASKVVAAAVSVISVAASRCGPPRTFRHDGHHYRPGTGARTCRRITATMDFDRLRDCTLPGLLVERARTRPAAIAFRAKELGVYRETSWARLSERVAAVALGFARQFGVTR